MKIQIVNFKPFLNNADAPGLTPPEMGAAFARYSRNNDGLEAILDLVKDIPEDKRVGKIMSFADYGHRSILDLVEVPIILEGISMYAAARIFQFAKLGAGQESSTRYIKKGFDLLPFAETTLSKKQYRHSERLFNEWIDSVSAIPGDASRDTRNKTLDKIRYILPVIATTNVAVKMSVRAWQELLQTLHSYPHEIQKSEMQVICDTIRSEMYLRCGEFSVKHSTYSTPRSDKLKEQLGYLERNDFGPIVFETDAALKEWDREHTLIFRKSRYDPFPVCFDDCIVCVKLQIPFAELRDLNRHRNRLVNIWKLNLDEVETPTLGTLAKSFTRMTLSQLLYEVEIRTSEGAHPSYRKIMNGVLDMMMQTIRSLIIKDRKQRVKMNKTLTKLLQEKITLKFKKVKNTEASHKIHTTRMGGYITEDGEYVFNMFCTVYPSEFSANIFRIDSDKMATKELALDNLRGKLLRVFDEIANEIDSFEEKLNEDTNSY
jgi:thymidylate synthase ThyX